MSAMLVMPADGRREHDDQDAPPLVGRDLGRHAEGDEQQAGDGHRGKEAKEPNQKQHCAEAWRVGSGSTMGRWSLAAVAAGAPTSSKSAEWGLVQYLPRYRRPRGCATGPDQRPDGAIMGPCPASTDPPDPTPCARPSACRTIRVRRCPCTSPMDHARSAAWSGIWAPGARWRRLAYVGLHALQHRGQESAGIATTDGTQLRLHKRLGLVSTVFDEETLDPAGGTATTGPSTEGRHRPHALQHHRVQHPAQRPAGLRPDRYRRADARP